MSMCVGDSDCVKEMGRERTEEVKKNCSIVM
jgi:hypothetical protein